jgi:hypothetical protein
LLTIHPQLDRRQHGDDQTNDHVGVGGVSHTSEAELPRGQDSPDAENEVRPLLPQGKGDEGADRDKRNRGADDPGIPGPTSPVKPSAQGASARQTPSTALTMSIAVSSLLRVMMLSNVASLLSHY